MRSISEERNLLLNLRYTNTKIINQLKYWRSLKFRIYSRTEDNNLNFATSKQYAQCFYTWKLSIRINFTKMIPQQVSRNVSHQFIKPLLYDTLEINLKG